MPTIGAVHVPAGHGGRGGGGAGGGGPGGPVQLCVTGSTPSPSAITSSPVDSNHSMTSKARQIARSATLIKNVTRSCSWSPIDKGCEEEDARGIMPPGPRFEVDSAIVCGRTHHSDHAHKGRIWSLYHMQDDGCVCLIWTPNPAGRHALTRAAHSLLPTRDPERPAPHVKVRVRGLT